MVDPNLMKFGIGLGIILFLAIIYLTLKRFQKDFETRLKKWEEVRKKGKIRFLIIHGVVIIGIPAAFLIILTTQLLGSGSNLVVDIIYYATVGLIAGLVWGYLTWRSSEKNYMSWKAGS